MAVAVPLPGSAAARFGGETLMHFSKRANRDRIILKAAGRLPAHANCRIKLEAAQGYSVLPFRLLRDYSVLDPWFHDRKSYGRYTYFFVGAPGWWAMKKNLGARVTADSLLDTFDCYAIRGSDLLSQATMLFYRPDDHVIVARGDYEGPAWVDPAP